MNNVKRLKCCYAIVILSVSVSLFGALSQKSAGQAGHFLQSILPAISVDDLKQKLQEQDLTTVFKNGGMDEIKKYMVSVNVEHEKIVSLLDSSTLLPSALVNLVEQYRSDGLVKARLVRNHFLPYSKSFQELYGVLTDVPNFPAPELSLLLDTLLNGFIGSKNLSDCTRLMQYIDQHYPRSKDDTEVQLFIDVALKLYSLMKKSFFDSRSYSTMYPEYKKIFFWLIERGVSIDMQYGEEKCTLLHYAISHVDFPLVIRLFVMGASGIIPDSGGCTAFDLLDRLGLRNQVKMPSAR